MKQTRYILLALVPASIGWLCRRDQYLFEDMCQNSLLHGDFSIWWMAFWITCIYSTFCVFSVFVTNRKPSWRWIGIQFTIFATNWGLIEWLISQEGRI